MSELRFRLAIALPLFVVAAFFLWFGGFVISNVFSDYKDSSDVTYLTIGGLSILIAGVFAAAALLMVCPSRRFGWLLLALVALVVTPLPYAGMVGDIGYAVNALLATLALGSIAALAASRHAPSEPPRQSSP